MTNHYLLSLEEENCLISQIPKPFHELYKLLSTKQTNSLTQYSCAMQNLLKTRKIASNSFQQRYFDYLIAEKYLNIHADARKAFGIIKEKCFLNEMLNTDIVCIENEEMLFTYAMACKGSNEMGELVLLASFLMKTSPQWSLTLFTIGILKEDRNYLM